MARKNTDLLLENSRTAPRLSPALEPPHCVYDTVVGAWVERDSGRIFVEVAEGGGPQSKKSDVETGEDQKGE